MIKKINRFEAMDGDKRIVKRFLFFPKKLKGIKLWWQWVEIEQEYSLNITRDFDDKVCFIEEWNDIKFI